MLISITNGCRTPKKAAFEWKNFRYGKTIVPSKPHQVEGVPTVIKVSGQRVQKNWGDRIIDFIGKLKASGTITDYNQVAFLFRSVKNERVKALADYLEQHSIPIYSPRSDMFFERDEIKLLIGTLARRLSRLPQITPNG